MVNWKVFVQHELNQKLTQKRNGEDEFESQFEELLEKFFNPKKTITN